MKNLFFCLAAVASGQPAISSVVNAASFNEMFAPGVWIMISGTGLAETEATALSVPLPKQLGGASVTIDGKDAGLLYASQRQINALIPYEIGGGEFHKIAIVVTTSAGISNAYSIYLNRNAPALFTRNASGSGRAFVFDALHFASVDTLSEGNVVVLYAAGLGQTDPPASSEAGASASTPVLDEVEVFIGDQKAKVLYAGLAPGFPGVYQLNVRVPPLWTDRLYLRQGGWVSNITEIGIPEQNNAVNVSGQIRPVPTNAGIDISQFLEAVSFQVELETRMNARPFVVAAVSEGGGAFLRIDPVNGMYQGWSSTTTTPAHIGDFSFMSHPVADFMAGCTPLAGNRYPPARLPPYWQSTLLLGGPPDVTFESDPTGVFDYRDQVTVGAHFGESRGFLAFLQVPCGARTSQTLSYKLYVDGKLIDSKQVSYKVAHP